MMRRLPLFFIALFALACAAKAEPVWLVIGASDVSAARIAEKSKPLFRRYPNGLIIQTHDCGDEANVFAWVAEVATSAASAKNTLAQLRPSVTDAYVKRCDVKPQSLLAFQVPAVDKSIADVPGDVMNWEDTDRVSSVQLLTDGRALVVIRYYANAPDDPLEGRRERVVLLDPPTKRVTLAENCPSTGRAETANERIAFQCAREQAGDHLLHTVLAFSVNGKKLAEISRCRNPRWEAGRSLTCERETVGPDGKLKLHKMVTNLPPE